MAKTKKETKWLIVEVEVTLEQTDTDYALEDIVDEVITQMQCDVSFVNTVELTNGQTVKVSIDDASIRGLLSEDPTY